VEPAEGVINSLPNCTRAAVPNPDPLMVNAVPPLVGPEFGKIDSINGAARSGRTAATNMANKQI
jgi:hypothetical protein